MQQEIDRLFNRFTHGGTTSDGSTSTWLPAVDIVEHENAYLVSLELPGVRKEDVKITVANDVLTVKGEKKGEKESKGKNYHRIERTFGSFHRSFILPTMVRSDQIEASYDSGILTITLPKLEEAKPKEIEVKVK
jgi:HSP20 family protein